MDKNKRKWILILLSLGFLVVFELIYIYIKVNIIGSDEASFCHVNSLIDCDGVSQTKYAQVFGIPLCMWGLFMYLFVLLLTFVDKLKNIRYLGFLEVFKNPLSYITSLAMLSFCISLILAGVQIWDIKKICVLCFATYLIDLTLVLVANNFKQGILYDVKVSIKDFFDAIKVKKYAIAFVGVVLLFCAFLTYTSLSYVFTPQVRMQKSFEQIKNKKASDFGVTGNTLGSFDAKVVIVEFSDFQCPYCSLYNTVILKVMTSGKYHNVKVIHKNFPLDKSCNKNINVSMHPQSCMLATYAIAAEKQGKHWDMMVKLFDNKPQSEKEVLEIASNLGLDVDKLKSDANSKEVQQQLKQEIREAVKGGIAGTPSIIIDGVVYNGMKFDYQLEDILHRHGAK